MINYYLLKGLRTSVILLSILFVSCLGKPTSENKTVSQPLIKIDSDFMEVFANEYQVKINGNLDDGSTEIYQLRQDGVASWIFVYDYGLESQKVDDTKQGVWIANKDTIIITIKGNSGLVDESFVFNSGIYVNPVLKKRSLVEVN